MVDFSNDGFYVNGPQTIVKKLLITGYLQFMDTPQSIRSRPPRVFLADEDFDSYRNELRNFIEAPENGILLNADTWWQEQQKRIASGGTPPNHGGKTAAVAVSDETSKLDETKGSKATFRLATSMRHQKEFISLWELFDHPVEFADCCDALVERAKSIRSKNPYSTIVTCTATAKHLLERIHSRIETDQEPVQVHYLHAHPFVSPDGRSTLSFRGQRVLLLTDVVASGALVQQLAQTVQDLGGTVVACLCVVVVGEDRVQKLRHSLEPPRLILANEQEIYLHSLTDRPIRASTSDDFCADRVISINPYTVYPSDIEILPEKADGAFTLAEFFDHTESSGALSFDFYEWDASRFTSAVNLERLFACKGDQIWEKVREAICKTKESEDGERHFVTTFNSTDLEFKEFVAERMSEDPELRSSKATYTYLQRQEVIRDTDAFLVFPRRAQEILRGQCVTVILSSIQSSQTLRDLASFLASIHVQRINIICLINRMGRRTHAFIARVRDLLKGLGGTERDAEEPVKRVGETDRHIEGRVLFLERMTRLAHRMITRVRTYLKGIGGMGRASYEPSKVLLGKDRHDEEPVLFTLKSIYAICDFETSDLVQIQETARTLLDHYSKSTSVPSFVNCTERFRKYFTSHQITGWMPEVESYDKLAEPLEIHWGGESLRITTKAGQMVWLVAKMIADRKFDKIRETIIESNDRREILRLCALLLHDVGHLRWSGDARKLQEELMKRIRFLRTERFEWEAFREDLRLTVEELGMRISANLEIEQHLILILAFLSYLDNSPIDRIALLQEVLTAHLEPDKWRSAYPQNFLRQFGDDQTMWVVSLLFRMSFQDGRTKSFFEDARCTLTGIAKDFLRLFDGEISPKEFTRADKEHAGDDNPDQIDNVKSRLRSVKDNLHMLLQDLGYYSVQKRDHVIRLLRAHVLTAERHSPIATNLNSVERALSSVILSTNQPEVRGTDASSEQDYRRTRFTHTEVQENVNEAIHAVSMLQTVAEAIEEFFGFTSCKRNEIASYVSPVGVDGFRDTLSELELLLQSIRKTNTVSKFELKRLLQLKRKIQSLLWSNESVLRRELERLAVPLKEGIIRALLLTRKSFVDKARPFAEVWTKCIESIRNDESLTSAKVLIDPFLLQETLRNLFTNARHPLRSLADEKNDKKGNREWHEFVAISIQPKNAPNQDHHPPFWQATVVTYGLSFGLNTSTPTWRGSTFANHAAEIEKYGGKITIDPIRDEDRNLDGCRVVLELPAC
jgi:hypothetical protein